MRARRRDLKFVNCGAGWTTDYAKKVKLLMCILSPVRNFFVVCFLRVKADYERALRRVEWLWGSPKGCSVGLEHALAGGQPCAVEFMPRPSKVRERARNDAGLKPGVT